MTPWLLESSTRHLLQGQDSFFVDKKDKSLCLCIDYWGLNDITIKNRYPYHSFPLPMSYFKGPRSLPS